MNGLEGLGFTLVLFGVILVFLGIALLMLSNVGNVEWGGGLVIFIGPIPIVIGGGKLGKLAILIAVLLAIAMILMFFVGMRAWRALA